MSLNSYIQEHKHKHILDLLALDKPWRYSGLSCNKNISLDIIVRPIQNYHMI